MEDAEEIRDDPEAWAIEEEDDSMSKRLAAKWAKENGDD